MFSVSYSSDDGFLDELKGALHEQVREGSLDIVREIAAKAIGPENIHLVTIELVEEADGLKVSIRGEESLVARIEAALDADEP